MTNFKDLGAVAFVVFMMLMVSNGDSNVNGNRTVRTSQIHNFEINDA